MIKSVVWGANAAYKYPSAINVLHVRLNYGGSLCGAVNRVDATGAVTLPTAVDRPEDTIRRARACGRCSKKLITLVNDKAEVLPLTSRSEKTK